MFSNEGKCKFCGKDALEEVNTKEGVVFVCNDCDEKVIRCAFEGCDVASINPDYFEYISIAPTLEDAFCAAHRFPCDECGKAITSFDDMENKKEYKRTDYYHRDCFYDKFSMCEGCDEYFESDELPYYECVEKCICDSCKKQYIAECKDCGKDIDRDNSPVIDADRNLYLCQRCFDEGYIYCSDCNDVISLDDALSDDDGDMFCPDCYPDGADGIDQDISKHLAGQAMSYINNELGTLYPIDNKAIDGNILPVLNASLKRYKDQINDQIIQDIVQKINGAEQKAAVYTELQDGIRSAIEIFNKLRVWNDNIKKDYPGLKGFKPLPVTPEITNSGHKGLTIKVPVDEKVLYFADKAFPGAREAYKLFLEGSGHHNALAYVRMTESEGAIIIDNVQTDWDIPYIKMKLEGVNDSLIRAKANLDRHPNEDRYKEVVKEYEEMLVKSKELEPALRWWVKAIDKFFAPYIINYVKEFAKRLNMPAYLTSTEMQKEKWSTLPERSNDIYETIPSQMGMKKERYYAKPESLKREHYEMTRIAKLLRFL